MRPLLRPLPQRITRPISILVLLAWVAAMAALVKQSYFQASAATLATDLARYGSAATWRGVYYRGEKIGFTVSQTVATDDGFDLEETGRLQMTLLGATTAATIRTAAHVDKDFALRGFEFSLDPGTGAIEVRGRVNGRVLTLDIKTPTGTRTEQRELKEPPALAQNLSRRLAAGGLVPGAKHQWMIFDPATLSNSPVIVAVGDREVVRTGQSRVPAFRVELEFAGLRTTSWITDTGDVIREESPLGLITVRETAETAQAMAVSGRMRVDMLQASSVVPKTDKVIGEPTGVTRMVLQLHGVDLGTANLDALSGGTQRVDGNTIELRDPKALQAGERDSDIAKYLQPELLIESDAAEIISEGQTAVRGATGDRERAERLTRYVNALLEKKPTVSLPSAREVLRTKVGDCNEHTVLYVAMARALGLPARIAIGIVYIHGAFYYHAWPEVYLREGQDRGLWLPVDPTLNQFPADATHLRLTRGGLEKQAAILPLIGQLQMTITDVEMAPDAVPILVGRQPTDLGSVALPTPARNRARCECPDGGRQ